MSPRLATHHGRPQNINNIIDGHANLKMVWPRNGDTGQCAPNVQQEAFISAPHKSVGLLGGAGAGKTTCGAMGGLDNAFFNKDSLFLIMARDYDMLKNVQWKALKEVINWWERVNRVPLVVHYSDFKMRMKLINGTEIICKTAKDISRVQGLQAQTIWCDEFPTWDDQFHAWREIYQRLRPTASGQRLKIFWTATPKGRYGITALLEEKAQAEIADRVHVSAHQTLSEVVNDGFCRIETATTDNLAQDPAYAESLKSILSPEEYEQDVGGKIRMVRGSVFGGGVSPIHTARTDRFNPSHSFRLVVDHGANYPYAAIIARDFDADGEARDTTIDEFTENDIRGVNEIITWGLTRMKHWGIAKMHGVWPDPDAQYKKENSLLAAEFRCPVWAFSDRKHRSVTWGTGLVKARLQDARGRRHLFVARHLLREPQNTSASGRGVLRGYMTQEWAEKRTSLNFMEELVDDWKDQPATHAMDAHRYYCSHEFQFMNPDGTLGNRGQMVVYK
jgi:hypothetical protein